MSIDHKHAFNGKQDRNFHQKPFDEVTDPLPQIDESSASLSENNVQAQNEPSGQKSGSETRDEINDDDARDKSDSTQDWDAENNRTGRHK